jgi:hypothetical protein
METAMKLPRSLRTLGLAGIGGIAIAAATATVASAHYTYTQCDRSGSRCWRVRCGNDGNDCRRIGYVYGNSVYSHRYYQRHHRRWVCDRDGYHCRWSYYGRPYMGFGRSW